MSDSGSVLADRLLIFIDKRPGVVIAIHTRICFADIFCHWGLLDWRCLEVNANFLEVKTARRPL